MPGERPTGGRGLVWALIALLATFVGVVSWQVLGGSAVPAARTSNGSTRRAAGAADAAGAPPPDVRLGELARTTTALADASRNPFRFGARAPAARPPGAGGPARPSPVMPTPARPSGPLVTPIPLKFIGVVEAPKVGRIAALSDGTFVYHGREGDVIEGRYRIVTIGVESIVMEHLDGRGRQTIRLTG
jgi:hypothetical protein